MFNDLLLDVSFFDKAFLEAKCLRRIIHQQPELSFHEENTSSEIRTWLQHLDCWKITEVDGFYGFFADFIINDNKPTIVFRAELDALPVTENTYLDYSSKNKGVMHACGHDVHVSILCGLAMVVQMIKDKIPYNIRLIFQHAEEVLPGGAKTFIERGILECINPIAVFGLHLSPELHTGSIGLFSGPFMASSDELKIKVTGKGGHAAIANDTINPIIVASHLVEEVEKLNCATLSDKKHIVVIGDFVANGATNVIPNTASLQGTMRTFDDNDRLFIKKELLSVANRLQEQYKCTIDLNIIEGYPSLINDTFVTNNVNIIVDNYLQDLSVEIVPQRMTSDDFAYYSKIVPSCFIRLGCSGERESGKLHSPSFCPDESCIMTGIKLLTMLVLKYPLE